MASLRVVAFGALALAVLLAAEPLPAARAQGLSISGPGPTASTQPGEAAVTPAHAATQAVTTQPVTEPAFQPSHESAAKPDDKVESLLHSAPEAPLAPPVKSGPAVLTPTLPGVAPKQPMVTRLREGDHIWYRTGRLLRDEQTGQWVFAFDSDGKQMKDPPMTILPSRMLKVMEQATDEGKKAVKLKISGEVTEYEGKNYLLVTYVQTVADMNQF